MHKCRYWVPWLRAFRFPRRPTITAPGVLAGPAER